MKSAGKILACRLTQKKNSSEEIKNLLKSTEKKLARRSRRLAQKKNFMEEIKICGNLRKKFQLADWGRKKTLWKKSRIYGKTIKFNQIEFFLILSSFVIPFN